MGQSALRPLVTPVTSEGVRVCAFALSLRVVGMLVQSSLPMIAGSRSSGVGTCASDYFTSYMHIALCVQPSWPKGNRVNIPEPDLGNVAVSKR
jgi:hypothetical protein